MAGLGKRVRRGGEPPGSHACGGGGYDRTTTRGFVNKPSPPAYTRLNNTTIGRARARAQLTVPRVGARAHAHERTTGLCTARPDDSENVVAQQHRRKRRQRQQQHRQRRARHAKRSFLQSSDERAPDRSPSDTPCAAVRYRRLQARGPRRSPFIVLACRKCVDTRGRVARYQRSAGLGGSGLAPSRLRSPEVSQIIPRLLLRVWFYLS